MKNIGKHIFENEKNSYSYCSKIIEFFLRKISTSSRLVSKNYDLSVLPGCGRNADLIFSSSFAGCIKIKQVHLRTNSILEKMKPKQKTKRSH